MQNKEDSKEELYVSINSTAQIIIGLLVPFLGTTLRFSFSIFIKKEN